MGQFAGFAAESRHSREVLRCLLELDVPGIVAVHKLLLPPGTEPTSPAEALASLHLARTQCARVPLKMRLYSQRWLNERGLGSHLPDNRREKN